MRKTITGTGGMLLLQTLKDAGVEYLFTNPGSAETGIFAALAEDGDQRLVVGKHEGLVAAMADGYHRMSGKVGVIIAHVMGGSFQLAGQLFNAQVAGSSVLVIAGDWTSELQDHRGLAPFPGLSQAESMRPLTKEARCAYQVDANPAAITVATARALREATTPPTGPVYLSISAELLNREGLEARIGEAAQYRIEGVAPARPETIEAMARRLGEARCPVLMFGDDVWRQGAQAEAVRLAETLEAPVFSTRQIFPNFPTRHPLYCGMYPVAPEFERISGLGAAPADDLIRQGVFDELTSLRQAREHDEEVGLRRQQEALEGLVALGFGADEPVQRHRMDDQQPVQTGRADRLAGASMARDKLFGGEIVLGHQSAKRGMTFSPTISMERMIWSCVVWPIWNMKII